MSQQDRRRSHGVYPSVEFVQMPQEKYTFRYFSEKRSHGTITIKVRVNDYEGPVRAVLACVTEEDPPMPHPNMVMCPKKHGCPKAVCTVEKKITQKKNEIVFSQIGILRVKREELEVAMPLRTSNTDFPYARGYDSVSRDLRAINLTRLRFACQVLIRDAAGQLTHPLGPVVTSRVTHYPEKLKIMEASHDCGPARGGLQIILLTAKLPKSVDVLFRNSDGDWRAKAPAVKQHQKVALRFTTPPYKDPYCLIEPVKVYYFMAQTMDNEDEQLPDEDNRRDFTYLPLKDDDVVKRKRDKTVSPPFMNFIEVNSGAGGDGAQGSAQHEGLMSIPSGELYSGAIPEDLYDNYLAEFAGGAISEALYQNPAEHYIPEPWPGNDPEFAIDFEAQGMEVDTTARHHLEQSLFIQRSLLEQLMEVDVPGYEDLPG